jgi:CheY-like chemotaxis protein
MIFHRNKVVAPFHSPPAFAAAMPAPTEETSPAANPAAQNRKVLVVDDDPVSVKALSLKLTSRGFSVVTANDGSQALSASRREKPDVMLVDINFPPDVSHGGGVPWNGFLITQWLQRLEETKSTPVILISSNDREEYKKRASAVGAAGFLPKSTDHHTLVTSIETALIRKADLAPAAGSTSACKSEAPNHQPERSAEGFPPASTADGLVENPTLEMGL